MLLIMSQTSNADGFYLFGFWAVGGLGFTNVTHHVKMLTLPMVLPFRVFRCGRG